MMQFLGVIEQRANEIMQRLARLAQTSGVDTSAAHAPSSTASSFAVTGYASPGTPGPGSTLVSLLGHGPSTQHGAEMFTTVDPPKIDDYSSVRGCALFVG